MNTEHNWDRLSHCGFKGLDRIARERRAERRFQLVAIAFLIVALIALGWAIGVFA